MKYNTFDNSIHGTSVERRASTNMTVVDSRFYDINEGIMYTSDGTLWRAPGESDPNNGGMYFKSKIGE